MGGGDDHHPRPSRWLITQLLVMLGSALNNFIVLLVKIFQAKKKILKFGPLAAEISLMQKSNDKSLRKIGLIQLHRLGRVKKIGIFYFGYTEQNSSILAQNSFLNSIFIIYQALLLQNKCHSGNMRPKMKDNILRLEKF